MNNTVFILISLQGVIVVGPHWEKVRQCSFIVAPGGYHNTNSDEDDWQGWRTRNENWDQAGERIRLRFKMHQYGQNTQFNGIAYQVTATGDLLGKFH
ncbi:MAG TPA: hypothetical protein VKA95_16820 [Nitrososphaeraceae archaeon]|nr:hypothetical protein [Nitrososphaeraceae archaeon]